MGVFKATTIEDWQKKYIKEFNGMRVIYEDKVNIKSLEIDKLTKQINEKNVIIENKSEYIDRLISERDLHLQNIGELVANMEEGKRRVVKLEKDIKKYTEDYNRVIEENKELDIRVRSLRIDKGNLSDELANLKEELQLLYALIEDDEIDKAKKGLKPKERQISENDINTIKCMYREGLSYSKISKEVKWSKATISRVVNGFYDN